MGRKKIGVVFAVDGEKDYVKAMADINKSLQVTRSESAKVKAEYEGQRNTIQALTAVHKVLTQKLEEQNQKVKTAREAWNHAKETYSAAEKRLEELNRELEDAEKKLKDAGTSSNALKKQLKEQTQEVGYLAKSLKEAKEGYKEMKDSGSASESELKAQSESVKKLTKALKDAKDKQKDMADQIKPVEEYTSAVARQKNELERCENKIKTWQQKLNTAEKELIETNRAVNRNATYMREAEEATDHCAKSIDKFGKVVDGAGEVTTGLGEKIQNALVTKGVSIATDALAEGVGAVKESMMDISKASSQLQASTGLSESAMQRYKKVMEEIKGNNFGEDYKDVADAMGEVIQIMGELNDADMKDITESAITLRDTFGMDINESIRAVDVMMKTMNVDAVTAFDLIAKGAQNGLNRSGELVDNITEYGQLWGQAGFSAEEMFAILENGLDAGAYNLDKVNDYVKEFGNSLADGRIEKNLGYFSDGTKKLFGEWKNGKASTSDVFYSVISDLEKMENQQEALTIASETWSALGEDNAMQVLTALNDVNDGYRNVRGTMESLKEVKYSDLESAVSGLGSALQENIVAPIADAALPAITGLFEGATKVIDGIGEAISPQKDAMAEFNKEAASANDELGKALENGRATLDGAEIEASKIETLGSQLMSLNGIEDKSLAQKYRLKEVVSQLGQTIPEIASAYNDEAGKVELTDRQIQNLIGSTKELMILQATQATQQELINKLADAEYQLRNEEQVKAAADEKIRLLEEEKQLVNDLQDDYFALQIDEAGIKESQLAFWKKALDEGKISLEEFNEATKDIDIYSITSSLEKRLESNSKEAAKLSETSKEAGKNVEELSSNVKTANAEVDNYGEFIDELSGSMLKQSDAAEKAGDNVEDFTSRLVKSLTGSDTVAEKVGESFGDFAQDVVDRVREAAGITGEAEAAVEDLTGTVDGLGDSIDNATSAAEDGANAQKEAAGSILDTYKGYVSEIESDLQNKISLFDKFDGGTDMTAEEMEQNMQSYLDGVKKYQENLAYVKEQMGDDLAPEFLQYIEDMGLDAANLLDHYAVTIEKQGEEGKAIIKRTADGYVEALDMTGGMAEVQAANRVAYEAAMGELGSSDVDFSNLRESIDNAVSEAAEGWENLPEATREEIDKAVQAAQECGIRIPDGLAEGIASGEVSPESAIAQLNGSLQGAFDGLSEMAKEAGIDISDMYPDLAAGIEAGGQEAVDACNQLVELIAGKCPELQKAIEESTKTGGMSSSIESEIDSGAGVLDEAATTYQEKSKALGDALADGIEEGAKAITDAVLKAVQAGADTIGENTETYRQAGTGLGAAVSEGLQESLSEDKGAVILNPDSITEKKGDYENAGEALGEAVVSGLQNTQEEINKALSPDTGGLTDSSGDYQRAGETLGKAFAEGLSSGKGDADASGGTLSEAARKAAMAQLEQMRSAGQQQAQKYIDALDAARGQAGSAGGALGSAAKGGAGAWENAFYSVGSNMAAGVASGINAGASSAINAAANMARQALSAAKATLGIHSPSKKFKDDVGKQVGKGFAFGIKDSTSLAGAAASQMSSQVYTKATAWITKYKKKKDVSLADEKYYWQQVAKHTQEGTDAYNKAVSKMLKASVSTTTKSGKKTVKKDAETYYSEVLSAAQKYASNQQVLNDWSLERQMSYWTSVRSQLKKGTQAWYDATKEINSLKDDIQQAAKEKLQTQANVQKSLLDKYKVYNKMSAKAEMEYWDIARKQFKAGTDERIEADENYLKAKEAYYEEAEELDGEYAENVKKVNDELADSIDALNKTYEDALDSRRKEILSSMGLFESWDAEGYRKDVLTANLKTQVEGLKFWGQQLEELGKKNVSQDLMDELAAMGPEAAANLWSLNQMTEEELEEYNKLWTEKNELAKQQAIKDNENLWKETQDGIGKAEKAAAEELAKLKSEYNAAVLDLNTGLSAGLQGLVSQAASIGEDIVSSLIHAISNPATTQNMTQAVNGIISDAKASAAMQAAADKAAAVAKSVADSLGTVKTTSKIKGTGSAADKAIMAAINSGGSHPKTLTKQEKSEHHDLWEYIVQNYGHKPNNDIYKKLAKTLGVSVSSKVTSAQKNEILKKLKAAGYAKGTKRVEEDGAYWLHEGELLIRKRDNAMLRTLNAGDGVIPARLTENLMMWGEKTPTDFLAEAQASMRRQQEELRSQMQGLDYSGITKLNRLMESQQPQTTVVNVDNSDLADLLRNLVTTVDGLRETIAGGIKLDDGTVIARYQPAFSRESAAVQNRRTRGRLQR